MSPYSKEKEVLDELDREDRRRRRNERLLVTMIIVIGAALAVLAGLHVTDVDVGYSSIRCEQGDVTLILTKADGTVERVECPAVIQPAP